MLPGQPRVFEASRRPGQLSPYFTTGGAVGRLEEGTTVQWEFGDFPGAFPVQVVEVVARPRIVLRWPRTKAITTHADAMPEPAATRTYVTFEFKALDDDRDAGDVAEEGWRETPAGAARELRQLHGLVADAVRLKVWVEHGINCARACTSSTSYFGPPHGCATSADPAEGGSDGLVVDAACQLVGPGTALCPRSSTGVRTDPTGHTGRRPAVAVGEPVSRSGRRAARSA
jgi:uncharacterized protein YndB with AHSA1/START domain